MGPRQGLDSRRRRSWHLGRDFIPVYQGKEDKIESTWVGKPCFRNAQTCGVSDFVTRGSTPGGGMDLKVII